LFIIVLSYPFRIDTVIFFYYCL